MSIFVLVAFMTFFSFQKDRRPNKIWIALFSFQIHILITKKSEPESPIKSVVVTSMKRMSNITHQADAFSPLFNY